LEENRKLRRVCFEVNEHSETMTKKKQVSFSCVLMITITIIMCIMTVRFRSVLTGSLPQPAVAKPMPSESRNTCLEPHSDPDGGDCQALKGELRRPTWACLSAMRDTLPEFIQLYRNERPIKDNHGGMRFDHSFALWYSLRQLQPKYVIESGAFKGHGTWIIRQALPHAKIWSLDPNPPVNRLPDVQYMVGEDFVDVAKVDWKEKGVDPQSTVMFMDDHQSAYRRIFLELRKQGFHLFLIEDNYPYAGGDNMSFKWVCELNRKEKWPGMAKDNFGHLTYPNVTWEQHLNHASFLPSVVVQYYEFPPVVASELSGQKRFKPEFTSKPIVSDAGYFQRKGLSTLRDEHELEGYTHFLFIEIDPKHDWENNPPPNMCGTFDDETKCAPVASKK
jgi:hypothetical protein